MSMNDIVLLCNCGWTDHPDVNRPEIWLTPEDIECLTLDRPVKRMRECPVCGYDIYIMKKCTCKEEIHTEVTNENYLIFEDIIDQYGGYVFFIKADTIPQTKLISREIADGKSYQGIVQLNPFSVSQLKELDLVELFDEGKTIRIGHKTAYSQIYDDHKKYMENSREQKSMIDLGIKHLIRTRSNLGKKIKEIEQLMEEEEEE